MAPSDNETRTSKTPRKRAAAKTTAGEAPARKRATKKTADAAPLAAAPKFAERPAAAVSMNRGTEDVAAPATAAAKPAAPVAAAQATPVHVPAAPRSVTVTAGARPDPALAKVVDTDERRRMIQEAAYHKFLERGPGHGTPAQDWIEAEAEIDALLAEQLVRTQ